MSPQQVLLLFARIEQGHTRAHPLYTYDDSRGCLHLLWSTLDGWTIEARVAARGVLFAFTSITSPEGETVNLSSLPYEVEDDEVEEVEDDTNWGEVRDHRPTRVAGWYAWGFSPSGSSLSWSFDLSPPPSMFASAAHPDPLPPLYAEMAEGSFTRPEAALFQIEGLLQALKDQLPHA